MLLPQNTRRGGLVEWPYLRVVAKLVCPNGDAHSPYTSHPFWILRLQNACLNQCGDALKCLCAHHLEYLMPNLFSIPFSQSIPLSASDLFSSPKRTTVVRRSHPFSSRTMLQIHEDRERKGTSFTFPLAFLSIPLYLFLCHFSPYSAFSCWWHF